MQSEATARLAQLIAAERDLLPHVEQRELKLVVLMEFLKMGLHGIAIWWAEHTEVSRTTLVEGVLAIVWTGLQSQFGEQSD